ncbi:hypothetical protein IWX49DRAFT_632057 [Phyllosticta citricarpa]
MQSAASNTTTGAPGGDARRYETKQKQNEHELRGQRHQSADSHISALSTLTTAFQRQTCIHLGSEALSSHLTVAKLVLITHASTPFPRPRAVLANYSSKAGDRPAKCVSIFQKAPFPFTQPLSPFHPPRPIASSDHLPPFPAERAQQPPDLTSLCLIRHVADVPSHHGARTPARTHARQTDVSVVESQVPAVKRRPLAAKEGSESKRRDGRQLRQRRWRHRKLHPEEVDGLWWVRRVGTRRERSVVGGRRSASVSKEGQEPLGAGRKGSD